MNYEQYRDEVNRILHEDYYISEAYIQHLNAFGHIKRSYDESVSLYGWANPSNFCYGVAMMYPDFPY